MKESEVGNEFVSYCPETGRFTRKFHDGRTKAWNTRYGGKPALTCRSAGGYMVGQIDGKDVYAHRVAWTLAVGEIPAGFDIDHINGDKSDNRITNLRLASRSENSRNKRAQQKSTSSYLGVSWSERYGKWVAQITDHGKNIFLGRFHSEDDAALAYDEAARRIHRDFARPNFGADRQQFSERTAE